MATRITTDLVWQEDFSQFSIAGGRFSDVLWIEFFSYVFCGKRTFHRASIAGGPLDVLFCWPFRRLA